MATVGAWPTSTHPNSPPAPSAMRASPPMFLSSMLLRCLPVRIHSATRATPSRVTGLVSQIFRPTPSRAGLPLTFPCSCPAVEQIHFISLTGSSELSNETALAHFDPDV